MSSYVPYFDSQNGNSKWKLKTYSCVCGLLALWGCPICLQRALLYSRCVDHSCLFFCPSASCGEEWSSNKQRAEVKQTVKNYEVSLQHCLCFSCHFFFLSLNFFLRFCSSRLTPLLLPCLFQSTCQPIGIWQKHVSSASRNTQSGFRTAQECICHGWKPLPSHPNTEVYADRRMCKIINDV